MTTDSASELLGQTVAGWRLLEKLGQGKTATVYKATKNCKTSAIKVFNSEITRRLNGQETEARIQRELTMIGKSHPNLVSIQGGGFDKEIACHYIVMDYLSGSILTKALTLISRDQIPNLILQLSKAARYLECLDLCHRDIKPDNILLTDNFMHLVLLDFGILRPLNAKSSTDDETVRPFIGTLRYSPPEFLLRQEQESRNGCRAITFYQIGAVLHDLIMRRPLFSDISEPYAVLCNAVQQREPEIQNMHMPEDLLELARKCLVKDWQLRLRLVNWSSFDLTTVSATNPGSIRQRIAERGELLQASRAARKSEEENSEFEPLSPKSTVVESIKNIVRTVRDDNQDFPRTTISVESLESTSGEKIGVKIELAESSIQGIPSGMSIQFEVSAIGDSSEIFEIMAQSFRHQVGPASEELGPRFCLTRTRLAPDVREKVEQYLYQVIDHFQKGYLRSALAQPSSGNLGKEE